MKKIISLLLAIVTAFTMTAFAAGEFTYATQNGALAIRGAGQMPDYSAGAPWQAEKAATTSLLIDAGVTGISAGAFAGCENLTSVSFPAGIDYIDHNAFTGDNHP